MKSKVWLLVLVILFTSLAGCSFPVISTPTPLDSPEVTPRPTSSPAPTEPPVIITVAELTFRVTLPTNTPPEEPILLSILDEVTGLAINTQNYNLRAENESIYSVTLQFPVGTTVKYRYIRQGEITAAEHSSDGRPVRYRIISANSSGVIHDLISRWNDTTYTGPTGRLSGQILSETTGEPVPNLLISAGGQQTLTRWDGSYLIEGLPPGTHNLVAYAMDGKYHTFQQGAVIADQSTTPGNFTVLPAELVPVEFRVSVPEDTIPAVPLRLAGSLHQLGNTFADLAGGISLPAERLPTLIFQENGEYILTTELPVGAFIRYKYTLGDGFWNGEMTEAGDFRLREFIVPEKGIVIKDKIASWTSRGGFAPIWFDVSPSEDTPGGDGISIQLNPWGWTQPLPMWQLAPDRWVYLLSSPLQMVGDISYRYCRAGQCGEAGEIPPDKSRLVSPSDDFQNFEDSITGWSGVVPVPEFAITETVEI